MSSNDPHNWERRLAGEVIPIHDGEPDYGFYRVRNREKTKWRPVTYWYDAAGDLRCQMDGADLDQTRANMLWPHASKHPVAFEVYGAVLRGEPWPDENVAVSGHNAAPPDDTAESIKDRIEDLAREAEKLIAAGGASTSDLCDQASDLANTFGELEAKAVRLHKDEKQPHLDEGRAVDGRWFPLRDRAAELKRRLKLIVVTPFLKKKSEDAQKNSVAAIAAGTSPDALPQTRLTAGSSKRSMGLRTQTLAVVEDWDTLLAALKAHPEIRETAQRIANASAKAGVALPGMRITKEQVAA